MTPDICLNQSGDDDRDHGAEDAPSLARDRSEERRNPYYRDRGEQQDPDLDADAPVLHSSEVQRLNRKALLFLAGIVALLVLMTFWLLGRGEEEVEPARQAREQAVVVPDLPARLEAQMAPPVPVVKEVPPLPVMHEEASPSAGYAREVPENAGPPQPTLVDRRISGLETAGGTGTGTGTADVTTQATQVVRAGAQNVGPPDALLVRGTYLRCVLETRIVTDIPGFTSCVLTEPVYSINGRSMLLPKGSKILGRYEQGADIARVAVVWDRVITPTGIDVSMQSPGVDGLGGSGHPGDYDGHWASKITSALLISLISDAFSWAAAEHGPDTSATVIGPGGLAVLDQPFESATARSAERLANQVLQRSANRRGTVTINQGTVVTIYVAQDVDFSQVLALPQAGWHAAGRNSSPTRANWSP